MAGRAAPERRAGLQELGVVIIVGVTLASEGQAEGSSEAGYTVSQRVPAVLGSRAH